MPNCDWGKPCDCIDCRTITETIICPNCQFKNSVDIVRESLGYSRDRKGVGCYDFSEGEGTKQDFNCYNCSFLIKDNIFTKLNKNVCERQKEINESREKGLFCQFCQKTEGELSGIIKKLHKKESRYICHNCLFEEIEKTSKDPSNSDKKYYLDHRTLKWELAKVRLACASCQRKRWLLAENTWKKYCSTCYRWESKRYFSVDTFNHSQEKKTIPISKLIPQIVYQPRLIYRNLNFNYSFAMAMSLLKRFKK